MLDSVPKNPGKVIRIEEEQIQPYWGKWFAELLKNPAEDVEGNFPTLADVSDFICPVEAYGMVFRVCGKAWLKIAGLRLMARGYNLTPEAGGRYRFAAFAAESDRHAMSGTQSGGTPFGGRRCGRSRKAGSDHHRPFNETLSCAARLLKISITKVNHTNQMGKKRFILLPIMILILPEIASGNGYDAWSTPILFQSWFILPIEIAYFWLYATFLLDMKLNILKTSIGIFSANLVSCMLIGIFHQYNYRTIMYHTDELLFFIIVGLFFSVIVEWGVLLLFFIKDTIRRFDVLRITIVGNTITCTILALYLRAGG